MNVWVDEEELLSDLSDEQLIDELKSRGHSDIDVNVDADALYSFFRNYDGRIPDAVRNAVIAISWRLL